MVSVVKNACTYETTINYYILRAWVQKLLIRSDPFFQYFLNDLLKLILQVQQRTNIRADISLVTLSTLNVSCEASRS